MDTLTLITNILMFVLVVCGGPLITVWGATVARRCTSLAVQRRMRILAALMFMWLVAGVLSGPFLGLSAVVLNLAIVVMVELCMGLGIIRTARGFQRWFRYLPFDLRIANNDGHEVYRTDKASLLDDATLDKLVDCAPLSSEAGEVVTVRLDSHPDTPFKVFRLAGGVAIVAEDMREAIEKTRQLERIREELIRQNELIAYEREIEAVRYRRKRERELSVQVERDLAEAAGVISELLDSLPSGLDERSVKERCQQLNRVKVLVAYSKRKGMLALEAAQGEMLTSDAFRLIAGETCADLRSIGIEAAALVDIASDVRVDVVNMLYDCFYECIMVVLPLLRPVVMAYFTTDADGSVCMRVSVECAFEENGGEGAESEAGHVVVPQHGGTTIEGVAEDVRHRLDVRGVCHAVTLEDDVVGVAVRVPEGGGVL